MNDEELKAIAFDWRTIVFDQADDIDYGMEYTWDGILIGFLLGRGVPLRQALEIAAEAPDDEFPI